MRVDRVIRFSAGAIAFIIFAGAGSVAEAQLAPIVINEFVKDSRTAGTGQEDTLAPNADTREFVELYNPNNSAVNIGGYTIRNTNLATNASFDDVLPVGSSIPAHGYFVMAAQGRALDSVANYKVALSATDGLFPDSANLLFELFDSSSTLQDAVATDTYRNPQTTPLSPTQLGQVGTGLRGRVESYNVSGSVLTYGRYVDGADSNKNGRDFGYLPVTPGASNNLALNTGGHAVPNVDALATGASLADYNYSFVAPRVIAPGSVDVANPKSIGVSPQGGKAISVWDETGGGNVAYSKDRVNKFDLWAYLDTTNLNMAVNDWEAEWTAYGIGSTDPQFRTPNLHGSIPGTASVVTQAENGSTGVGWFYERFQNADLTVNTFKLSLVDFGQGGNNVPGSQTPNDGVWDVVQTFNLTNADSGWHRLSVDYDPATGQVVAKFDGNTVNYTTDAGRTGNFYAGYREGLTGVPAAAGPPPVNFVDRVRPATFDMIALAVNDADFDNDGDVDGTDFLTWQRGLGAGNNSTGDADGNGQVNAADLAIWKGLFGLPATVAGGAIPEPAGLGLAILAVGAVATCGKPRRKLRIT